jgi:Flp pilus assembly protein TadG
MWRNDRGAQLVEFAVSLPLLVVFVVGIFDFSGAFTLRQKLTNVARDAARVAAADPATDLGSTTPVSVADAFQVVDNYLIANNLSDCGVTQASLTAGSGASALTWSSSAGSCPTTAGLATITINRGYYFPPTGAGLPSVSCTSQSLGVQGALIGTCVSIQYAYQWRFGRVAGLLGASSTLPSTISATAVALNEN